MSAVRQEAKLSQAELAKLVGVHSQFVSNWERGLCRPPEHSLKKMAEKNMLNKVAFRACLTLDAMIDAHLKTEEIFNVKKKKTNAAKKIENL